MKRVQGNRWSGKAPVIDRLMSWITKDDSGCWLWNGILDAHGYGKITISFCKTMKTHRAMWQAKYGDIPNGLWVLHKCDVRNCINPDHLFLGTRADNMRDMVNKGRSHYATGANNPNAKLSLEQVRFIRNSQLNKHILAKRFGVCANTIYQIRKGEKWKEQA